MLQRRFISFIFSRNHTPYPTTQVLNRYGIHKGVSTNTNPIEHVSGDLENGQADNTKSSLSPENVTTSVSINEESAVKFTAKSSLKISPRHDFVMVFTCKVCETRSVKAACRESYEKGVVVARCEGCNNLHLIADRLGWFGEPGSIEDYLAANGEEVKKGAIDTLNLTLEDIAGKKP
ncbi:PREDICTED: uncharacterized protein C24H6.02c isoform X2 [Lupinus angustifolius]|uniref:uncharacterized protein C24H6.02c isoform X2 n=1 Tax=Lupinus angustifolius TaxID=3871 RepID=UPI00092FB27F|nr:PREDICTED: uncharacterized protein C24H6.02c isoform X2 [Lupinus angustifolius]